MPATRIFDVGERYGRLTVIERRDQSTQRTVLCRCDCGTEVSPTVGNLPRTRSCGCSRSGEGNHRWNGAPRDHELYSTWRGMLERCTNPGHRRYADYGGRYEPGNVRWCTASEQNTNQRPRPLAAACAAGHEYTDDNTRVNSRGDRACRTCDRERARASRARTAVA